MNIIDLGIILLIMLGLARGRQIGFVRQAFSAAGFLGGLLLGALFARKLAAISSDQVGRAFLALFLDLMVALVLASLGEYLGIYINKLIERWRVTFLDKALGAIFEVGFILLAAWLVGSAVANLPTYNIGRLVKQSAIIQVLDKYLPAPPDLLAQLEKVIDPNGFPRVFVGLSPHQPKPPAQFTGNLQAITAATSASVVEITGRGCGGIVEGSGFVVSPGIVATNAHVIAGVRRPSVTDASGTHVATAIWFDPNRDFAVLSVNDLKDPPLKLDANRFADNSSGAALGYPGGGPLTTSPAVVIDEITALGQNIYDEGRVARDIYEVQADVEPGNSGGPLVDTNGVVRGIIFAKSVDEDNVGYALTLNEIMPSLKQAEASQGPVGTGQCAS